MMRTPFFFVLASSALAACSSSNGGSAAGADGGAETSIGAAETGDPAVLAGTFQVQVSPPAANTAGTTSVIGRVYDGATPSTLLWTKADTDGACTLLTPKVPFCSTPCGGSKACVADDTCQAYPSAHSVGAVKVTGLLLEGGGSELTMTAVSNTYQATAKLAYPPFSEGDAITIAAAGDYYPAFTIAGNGILPLTLTSSNITLQSGQPLDLAWTPGRAGIATVHVKLDISHHGGTKGKIECDTGDTGTLSIGAALITKLLALGVAGYPTIVVTRQSISSTTIAPGRVDLTIASTVEQAVTVPGVTSCTANDTCPSGTTCQTDLTCK